MNFLRILLLALIPLCTPVCLEAAHNQGYVIGISNSNPGNLRAIKWKWWRKFGATGVDPWHHLIFKSDKDGLKALRYVLQVYGRKGHNTVNKITKRWVGPRNFEAACDSPLGYRAKLLQDLRVRPNAPLDMNDPKLLATLAKAIVYAENGVNPYSEKLYKEVFGY